MRAIDLQAVSPELLSDIAEDGAAYEAFEADYPDATVANQAYHIVFSAEHGRGGIVFVGSGSSGATAWTDASSPDEVLARFTADEMRG